MTGNQNILSSKEDLFHFMFSVSYGRQMTFHSSLFLRFIEILMRLTELLCRDSFIHFILNFSAKNALLHHSSV